MKRSLLIVCILIFSLLIAGCTYFNSNTSSDTISSGKYVTILEEYTNQSTLIGTTPYTPIQPPPIPTCVPVLDFDNSHGFTKSYLHDYGVTVDDRFKVFLFKESFINTPTSLGFLRMSVNGVYDLPYTADGGFTIVNITSNGTIMATYNDQPIILRPGENTTITAGSANTTGAYLANQFNNNTYDYMNMTEMPWPVHSEQVYTFTNEGMFNKSLLSDAYANK